MGCIPTQKNYKNCTTTWHIMIGGEEVGHVARHNLLGPSVQMSFSGLWCNGYTCLELKHTTKCKEGKRCVLARGVNLKLIRQVVKNVVVRGYCLRVGVSRMRFYFNF